VLTPSFTLNRFRKAPRSHRSKAAGGGRVGWHIDESDQPTRPARPTPPTIGRPPTRMSLLSLRVISRALKVITDVSRRHHRYRSGGTLKRRRRGSKQVRERAERVLAAPRSVDITSTATVFSGKPGRTPAARRPRAPPAPCPDPVPASGVFLHRCRTARSGVDRSHSGGPPRGPAGPGRPAPGVLVELDCLHDGLLHTEKGMP